MGDVRQIRDSKNRLTAAVNGLQEMVKAGKITALVALVATSDDQHSMAICVTPDTNLHALIGGVALLQHQLERSAFEDAALADKEKR